MTGLARILPVPCGRSPYDDAALNNLYASASRSSPPRLIMVPDEHLSADGTSASSRGTGRLADLLEDLSTLASDLGDDPEALLDLLRQLEQLHRRIQDGPFRASLPADRNQLFNLLQRMEASGGWPYIPRLQLRTFMDLLQRESGPAPQGDQPLAA